MFIMKQILYLKMILISLVGFDRVGEQMRILTDNHRHLLRADADYVKAGDTI